jgi:hypothetical protein
MALEIPSIQQTTLPGVNPLANILQGYQAVHSILRQPQLEEQQRQQAAANLARIQAQTQLYGAQTQRALHPNLTAGLTGSAAEAMSINRLSRILGPNSPEVKAAKDKMAAQTAMWNQMAKYRGLPQVTKLQMERDAQLASGNVSEAAETGAALAKQISDKNARQQYQALSGVADDMSNVDMNTLSQYAGPMGHLKLYKDEGLASIGITNPSYQKYQIYTKQVKAMGDQLRKALGTSVRNEYVKNMLLPLVDSLDKIWGQNPQIAMSNWQWAHNWITRYRDMYHKFGTEGLTKDQINNKILSDPSMTQKPPAMQMQQGNQQQAKASAVGWQGNIYVDDDGKQYTREQLQAIAAGGK